MKYQFDTKDCPQISLEVLIEIFAFVQAKNAVILDEQFGSDKAAKLKEEIADLTLELKKGILKNLYTQYGSTPNIS